MKQLGINAKKASFDLLSLNTSDKNHILEKVAEALDHNRDLIKEGNALDLQNGLKIGLSEPLMDRLKLDDERIDNMIRGIKDIRALDDPIGEVLDQFQHENGMIIEKVRVPLGVVSIIYESRPNVTVDAFALSFKAGNSIILKGGKEAIETNIVLERIVRDVLEEFGYNPNFIQLIKDTDRKATAALMKLDQYVDVLIPRGSSNLIQAVLRNSTIPVIETGEGNCHIYIDRDADLEKAVKIVENAKLQRLGVCNACESLVIHEAVLNEVLPKLIDQIESVEFVGDDKATDMDERVTLATAEDFYTEYLDKKLSVKVVSDEWEAIEHINQHHTQHSDAIITENHKTAELFMWLVDSSSVYVNASTRFTDGFEFGLGAEMGISTQKLHARGPMGLKELTTYKYLIKGKGQIRI